MRERVRDERAQPHPTFDHWHVPDEVSGDENESMNEEFSDEETELEEEEMIVEPIKKPEQKPRKEKPVPNLNEMSMGELVAYRSKVGDRVFQQHRQRTFADEVAAEVHNKTKIAKESVSVPRRENKNQPQVMSSKRPVPFLRQIVPDDMVETAAKPRDPRFDTTRQWNENEKAVTANRYRFLKEIRNNELNQLREQLHSTKDNREKERIKRVLQSMESRAQHYEKERQQKEKMREFKKAQRAAVANGAKPFFLKRSQQKLLPLLEKYEDIKKTRGEQGLEQALEKRRRQNATSQHRFLPSQQRHHT